MIKIPSFEIDINFNVNSEGLTEAETELENIKGSAEEIGGSTEQASDGMENFKEKTNEANESMQQTTDSAFGLGEALVGIGGAVGLDAIIGNAGKYEDSWNRLSLTFDGTGVSMDTLKQKSSELNAETGRSGGQIREYFNQMGIAGVTNTELLTSSFEALSGKAYQTNSSVEQMSGKMSMMVMSGMASNRMLKSLGLSTEDLANAMGVTEEQVSDTFKSLSQEERIQALTTAMGDGTEANEMYKTSYEGLKAQAEASLTGLGIAVGQTILPIVIPAMQGAKGVIDGLTGAFRGLPSPVQSFIGLLGGGIMGVTALTTAFSLLTKVLSIVWGSIGKIISLYGKLTTALTLVRNAVNMMRTAESLSAGVKAVMVSWLGAERVAQIQNAIAKASAVVPTQLLAIAENSLLLPVLLVIGAIALLIGVLWYLYNNNEMVRQGINWLIQQFQLFIGKILQVGQIIISFVSNAISTFLRWVSAGSQASTNLVNAIYNALVTLPSRINSALSGVTNIITKPFTDAWNIVKPYIDQIGGAWNSISGIFSGAEYEGVQYEGFDNNTLNGVISSSSSNSSSVTNNFNINGIIEEEASQYIVNSVNDYVKKQNLIRGV